MWPFSKEMNTAIANPYQRAFLLLSITDLKTPFELLPEILKNLIDIHGTTIINGLRGLAGMWGKKGSKPKMVDHIFKPTPESNPDKSAGKVMRIPVMNGGDRIVRVMN